MKNLLKFVMFLVYTLGIFMVSNYFYLLIFAVINLIFAVIFKVNIKKIFSNLYKIGIVILITIIFNMIFADVETALLIGVRLVIVCNATYIFANIYSYMKLAKSIEILLYPMKYIGVSSKDIGLIICIAVAFIPILKNEIEDLKNVLIVKGFNIKFANILKNLNLIFKPFFISLLQRVNEIETTLKAKAYQE